VLEVRKVGSEPRVVDGLSVHSGGRELKEVWHFDNSDFVVVEELLE